MSTDFRRILRLALPVALSLAALPGLSQAPGGTPDMGAMPGMGGTAPAPSKSPEQPAPPLLPEQAGRPRVVPSMGSAAILPPVPHAEPLSALGKVMPTANLADRRHWSSPVHDNEPLTFLLFDELEYQHATGRKGDSQVNWDILGWRGTDYQRVWFRSEGTQNVPSRKGGQAEVQALYGKLVAPFFDLVAGVRFDQGFGSGRTPVRSYLTIGLQGLAPYNFEIEPAVFLSQRGQLSARFTGTYDLLLTQRLVLQPRLETNAALQRDAAVGSGMGLNDIDVGLRLRYEIRREFAPYIGISFGQSFGDTRSILRREGTPASRTSFVSGIRFWY